MDGAPTNGELKLMYESLKEHVTSEKDAILEKVETTRQQIMVPINLLGKDIDEVKEQTTKHNGRMTKMEALFEQAKGGAKVLGVVAVVILSLIALVYHNLENRLERVDDRLSSLDDK